MRDEHEMCNVLGMGSIVFRLQVPNHQVFGLSVVEVVAYRSWAILWSLGTWTPMKCQVREDNLHASLPSTSFLLCMELKSFHWTTSLLRQVCRKSLVVRARVNFSYSYT